MHPYPCTHCHSKWRNVAEWFMTQYAAMFGISREEALQDYEEAHDGREG
jgi:hypothetical protein